MTDHVVECQTRSGRKFYLSPGTVSFGGTSFLGWSRFGTSDGWYNVWDPDGSLARRLCPQLFSREYWGEPPPAETA